MSRQSDVQLHTSIKFHRIYSAGIPPLWAEPSTQRLMPSSFGWYAYPAEDVHLRWNGSDVFVALSGEWQPLLRAELPGFSEYWNAHASTKLLDTPPPFLARMRVPGLVQIWTGLLCSTAHGWSVRVRPPGTLPSSALYSAYEGIVETDRFKPCPLFMNIQLHATDVDIRLPKWMPLLQVQPFLREDCDERALPRGGLMAWEYHWTANRR